MDTTTPIGIETIDRITDTGQRLYDFLQDAIPPEREYWRIDDAGDGVYPEDWDKVWKDTPEWWQHAWLLLDNIEIVEPGAPRIDDTREGIAAMSIDEIERIHNSEAYCGAEAYYTDSGDEGIGWWDEEEQ